MLPAVDPLSEDLQTWRCSCVDWQVVPVGYIYNYVLDKLLIDWGS